MTDAIDTLPKAVLHEHLDGGLRIETVLELADAAGHELPTTDRDALADWFDQGRSGSLERYLAAFDQTLGVMQTPDAVRRVAYESIHDLAADGVVYAEVRFDPALCTVGGATRDEVLEATLDGLSAAGTETGLVWGLIVTAVRHLPGTDETARAAVRFRDAGVVAFDLAGPEVGHPNDDHLGAIGIARRAGLGITLHAGEGDGPHSMWRSIALCGADRIGHGVRIADDTDFDGETITKLGRFAASVRDHRVPLEVSVTSNMNTGLYPEGHPLGALYRAGFNVTINTDNRLMSRVALSGEYRLATDRLGLSTSDLGTMTVAALEAGFCPWPERKRLIDDVVRPAYGI